MVLVIVTASNRVAVRIELIEVFRTVGGRVYKCYVLVVLLFTVLQHSSSICNGTGKRTGICYPLKDSGELFLEDLPNYLSSCWIGRWEIK